MMLVKAGAAVDSFIDQLVPLLEKGDIIIDGGNSEYTDSQVIIFMLWIDYYYYFIFSVDARPYPKKVFCLLVVESVAERKVPVTVLHSCLADAREHGLTSKTSSRYDDL